MEWLGLKELVRDSYGKEHLVKFSWFGILKSGNGNAKQR